MVNEIIKELEIRGISAEEFTESEFGYKRIVINTGDRVQPVFTLKDEDETVDEVVSRIERQLKAETPQFDIEELSSAEYIIDNAYVGVTGTKDNKTYYRDTKYEGIYEYIYISMPGASYRLNADMCENYELDMDELFAKAEERTFAKAKIESLLDIMKEMTGDELEGMTDVLIVISNENKYRGAANMLSDEILGKAADMIGTDELMIIPSSIHEVIVLDGKDADLNYLSGMVSAVNTTDVEPQDVLSNTAYRWAR